MKSNFFWKGGFFVLFLSILGLLYWSLNLQEADLKHLHQEVKALRSDIGSLGQKIQKIRFQPLETETLSLQQSPSPYPNVLINDPYFSQILPAQLGENFQPQGILKHYMLGHPQNLHPFNGFRDVSEIISLCTVQVATLQFGKYETLCPHMATRLEVRPHPDRADLEEHWVFLRDNVYWQPLKSSLFPDSLKLAPHFFASHPVTAHDFKFFYDAVMNPYVSEAKAASLRTYFIDIADFRVVDDLTFVVTWKKHPLENTEGPKAKYTALAITGGLQPLASFVYQYFTDGKKIVEEDQHPDTYKTHSIWAQNFTHHWANNYIVSCGPYFFNGMSEEGISLKRNPDYYNPFAALLEGIHYSFKENTDSVWQDFKTGKLDLCILSSSQVLELDKFLDSPEYKSQPPIKQLDFVDLSFSYLGWNLAKPYFKSSKVRQAMTMAIDRQRILEQNLNNMGVVISGPFFCFSSSNNPGIEPLPFNPLEASRLLEAEGWIDMDGSGIRSKLVEGRKVPFRFTLCYYVKSILSKNIADYIVSALKEIGVECHLRGLDVADLSRQFEDKDFDAIFMAWKLGSPPDDPRQLWHSSGALEKGSSNAIGFQNPVIDTLIDKLSYEYNKTERVRLYHQFHQILHQEAPYTFLFTPKVRLLYRDYVKNLFIPLERQDLVPGADIPEPNIHHIWLNK